MIFALDLESRYADNNGTRIHYKAGGDGPLIVFIHGFPDFWYSWRHQIAGLIDSYSVAAMDTRGYNLSDAPEAFDSYAMEHLIADVEVVINAENRSSAVIVGHDWGGAVAWRFAQQRTDAVERLVVVNTPHPAAIASAMQRDDPSQRDAFGYMAGFAAPGSEDRLDPEELATSVARTEQDRELYVEAFGRSSRKAMMNYYRQQSPTSPTPDLGSVIRVPVLQFHGLEDPALLASSLNNTWDHLGRLLTLITIPGAGHWAHHDEPELINDTMRWWLQQTIPAAVILPASGDIQSSDVSGGCCT